MEESIYVHYAEEVVPPRYSNIFMEKNVMALHTVSSVLEIHSSFGWSYSSTPQLNSRVLL